jgi:hypothetical protein
VAAQLKNLLQGDFIEFQAGSWIEVADSGYSLCALSYASNVFCERLSALPWLPNVSLSYLAVAEYPSVLILAFEAPRGAPDLQQRTAIGVQFASNFAAAKTRIAKRLLDSRDTSEAISALPSKQNSPSTSLRVATISTVYGACLLAC